MAKENEPSNVPDPELNGWKKGTRSPKAGGRRRAPANCIVTPSGYWSFNVEGTDRYDTCGRARGIEEKICQTHYLTNVGAGKVSFYPTMESGPGTVTISRTKTGHTTRISFFHPGPFDEEPSLRPVTKVKATVVSETNPYDKLPMISVILRGAPPHITQSRKKKDEQGATAPAAKQATTGTTAKPAPPANDAKPSGDEAK
jgi:hypothetical protein